MLILLLFAFVSGLLTILAPCIWPLLPIVFSASSTGGKTKPLGITLGVILSFTFFTLALSYLIKIIPFDPNVIRLLAVAVLIFFGLVFLIPSWNIRVEGFLSHLSGKIGSVKKNDNGFLAGFLIGFSLGIVWSPCAGPILGTIAVLASTQSVNISVIILTLVYVTGIGIPLFIFATVGNKIVNQSRFLNKYLGKIQQLFGVIMILTALAILTNFDKTLEARLLNFFPSYSDFVNKFESNQAVKTQLDQLKRNKNTSTSRGNAPEFTGINKWLNTDKPLTLASLKGKVVLVDFWTYTCINCIRTLPHLTAWYEKYKNQGFVVVGVHTPEFEFEKNTNNVKDAIKRFNIGYPVAQDNDYATWNAFNNQYWPAEYLIDANGNIRHTHFGEGEYDATEQLIKDLLVEAGKKVTSGLISMPDTTPKSILTPETYLGSSRSERSDSSGNPQLNYFSLNNKWDIQPEFAKANKGAILQFHFIAGHVYLVMHPNHPGDKVKVFLDNKLINTNQSGKDISSSTITLDSDRLYEIVDLHGKNEEHLLRLEFENEGIECFAFTFG
jgi:cytochrome c biogenesis protein CcdA/thiol-disulfide isomerase/thioredoxin